MRRVPPAPEYGLLDAQGYTRSPIPNGWESRLPQRSAPSRAMDTRGYRHAPPALRLPPRRPMAIMGRGAATWTWTPLGPPCRCSARPPPVLFLDEEERIGAAIEQSGVARAGPKRWPRTGVS
jgi:hypothetical protein